jgi:hypothetical protein
MVKSLSPFPASPFRRAAPFKAFVIRSYAVAHKANTAAEKPAKTGRKRRSRLARTLRFQKAH